VLDPGYARATARAKFRGIAIAHVSQLAAMSVARSRYFLGFSAAAACALAYVTACASSTTSTGGGGTGDVSDASGGSVDDAGAEGATCSFNRDCHLALRCECNETTGCACKTGARGAGKNGIDPCTSGNDCVSSVCVEGPPDSGSFCSDECKTSGDCTGVLPLCTDVAFVGRICTRTAPQ